MANYLQANPSKELGKKYFPLFIDTLKDLPERMGVVSSSASAWQTTPTDGTILGLVSPAGVHTSGIPDAINGHKVSAAAAAFAWAHALHADKYRPFKQIMGVDAEPVSLPLTNETDLLLEGRPAGCTVRFYVESYNVAATAPRARKWK